MTDEISVYCLSEYLISRKGSGNSRTVHAPAGEGYDRPLCEHTGEGGGNPDGYDYRRKPSAVIPDGHYSECSRCKAALQAMPLGWWP